jgi:hypothetical protein
VFHGIRDLLFHPDAFFARVSQEKVNLIPPLAIVGAGVVINILMISPLQKLPFRKLL